MLGCDFSLQPMIVYLDMKYLILLIASNYMIFAQAQTPSLEDIFKKGSESFQKVLQNRDIHRIQIRFTRIERNSKNQPAFKHFSFHNNPSEYFYPASTVKFPIALLAIEKINELNIPGLTIHTTMVTDSTALGQDDVYQHPQAGDGRPSIAHYIKQIFLVSDNDAFNRLYEFLGQEYIYRKLKEKGFKSSIIRHRLSISLTDEANRATNGIRFFDENGQLIYQQSPQFSKVQFPEPPIEMGKGYMKGGQLIQEPFSFTQKNRLSIEDLHNMMIRVIFPNAFPEKIRFKLSDSDLKFLYHWMSAYPSESQFPEYPAPDYWNTYVKFLLYGSEQKANTIPSLRIFNKVGNAYGFLTDVAYFADYQSGTEFFLSATIYTNRNEIFNDNKYEYNQIGFPFLKELGLLIFEAEKMRIKKKRPNLSNFEINYQANR